MCEDVIIHLLQYTLGICLPPVLSSGCNMIAWRQSYWLAFLFPIRRTVSFLGGSFLPFLRRIWLAPLLDESEELPGLACDDDEERATLTDAPAFTVGSLKQGSLSDDSPSYFNVPEVAMHSRTISVRPVETHFEEVECLTASKRLLRSISVNFPHWM